MRRTCALVALLICAACAAAPSASTGIAPSAASGIAASFPASTAPTASTTSALPSPSSRATPLADACAGKNAKDNIYNPDRLEVLDPCKTVTGIVMTVRREADGDYHIGLRLDAGQERLINDKNRSGQDGNLVLEIICANPVTQQDAKDACAHYTNAIAAPPLNAHLSATGPYVLDLDHGWNEIHPVWAVAYLDARATAAPSDATTATVAPAVTPPGAAPTTQTGASVTFTSVRSPVSRGSTANVAVQTLAGTGCTIRVTYASGPSQAQGLTPKTADGSGAVSWSWTVGPSTTPGQWPVDVTCGAATARAFFTVQ